MNDEAVAVSAPKRRITCTIDGAEVKVAEGATVRDACTSAGIDTPTLCWGDTLKAKTACRVCVVEVEGNRTLVPSCSRQVEAGMVVHTDTERVQVSRRTVLELLGSSVDMSITPEYDTWRARYDANAARFGTDVHTHAAAVPKVDNDLYVRDYAKCILCYKCVDACGPQWQNTFAIAVAGRGFASHIATEFDVALPESACVYCGNCIEVCPTGALEFKTEFDKRADGTWDEDAQSVTDTICPFCGVGCTLRLTVQDNEIVRVHSPHDHSVTHGNLCIKGRFGSSYLNGDPASKQKQAD